MSYIAREITLSAAALERAFEKAREDKKRYLIQYGTSSYDFRCVEIEYTSCAKDGKLNEEISKLYQDNDTSFQSFYITKIYDTSKAFNDVSNIDLTEKSRKVLDELRYKESLKARPFWKKWLNLEP
ncbi:MAG: hypothetical protein VYC19_06790 [Pseudomonadota bacterium]|jgi:hypothetical protein|nr:hypothetical protein [Pseudomonadota bacterium]MEC7702444.1 hypothetical protein [Pseudomonadota bacterium]MEE3323484.1 hypothetical protein [Pseudomonadota bacterium]